VVIKGEIKVDWQPRILNVLKTDDFSVTFGRLTLCFSQRLFACGFWWMLYRMLILDGSKGNAVAGCFHGKGK
jgi:hypothetical protein